jgi:hypothetical protein
MLTRLTSAMALALLVFAAAFVLARTGRDEAPATAGAAGLERVTVSGPAKVSGLAPAAPLPDLRRPPIATGRPPSATATPAPTAAAAPEPSATVAPEPAPAATAPPAPSGGGGGGDTPVGGGGGGG